VKSNSTMSKSTRPNRPSVPAAVATGKPTRNRQAPSPTEGNKAVRASGKELSDARPRGVYVDESRRSSTSSVDSETRGKEMCFFREKCNKAGECRFMHPGDDLNNNSESDAHRKVGSATRGKEMCFHGDRCKLNEDGKCRFAHPGDELKDNSEFDSRAVNSKVFSRRPDKECNQGAMCRYLHDDNSCTFKHSPPAVEEDFEKFKQRVTKSAKAIALYEKRLRAGKIDLEVYLELNKEQVQRQIEETEFEEQLARDAAEFQLLQAEKRAKLEALRAAKLAKKQDVEVEGETATQKKLREAKAEKQRRAEELAALEEELAAAELAAEE
jgi:hypothetical protein